MGHKETTISPLVLLSIVDHYGRFNAPRVVGVLLGNTEGDKIFVTNSFAIPFEEFDKNYFFDTSYLKNMYDLFYKVNCKEKIVGWYHSGPKMYKNDLELSKAFTKYCDDPILAIVDVKMKTNDFPAQIYQLKHNKELVHTSVQISGDETEVVGVEHLLRDLKDGIGFNLSDNVEDVLGSLLTYSTSLEEIIRYIEKEQSSEKPNFEIMELLQDILNEIPKLTKSPDFSDIYSYELANTLVIMNDLQRNRSE